MKTIKIISCFALTSSVAMATPFTFDGQMKVTIPVNKDGTAAQKQLVLPKMKVSKAARQQMHTALNLKAPAKAAFGEVPVRVKLGMQNTPVLDQGQHGTCVTFAVTAAVDALLGAGDYVSQLCNLELGSYLSINDRANYSGWEGTWGTETLNQINEFGVVSQNYQKLNGCAGVRVYNLDDETDQGTPMSDIDFTSHSIPMKDVMDVHTILDASTPNYGWGTVIDIRQALAKGNRVVVGMLLDTMIDNRVGAVGQMHVPGDTWMLVPQISDDILNFPYFAGHEMVITGYDDSAVVTDDAGHTNYGVFTLRNSWSQYAGDQGNYYVTYDYFRLMGEEAHELSVNKE